MWHHQDIGTLEEDSILFYTRFVTTDASSVCSIVTNKSKQGRHIAMGKEFLSEPMQKSIQRLDEVKDVCYTIYSYAGDPPVPEWVDEMDEGAC